MNTSTSKILTSDDFLDLIELNALSMKPSLNGAKIVIIPHSYRDETIELIELGSNKNLDLRVTKKAFL